MPRGNQLEDRRWSRCVVSEFTGERVVPGQVNDDLWAEHISRYAFAARGAAGASVLDIGCGTGYGTSDLAQSAHWAVGIDIAVEAITYGRAHFGQPNLSFIAASATALPFADSTFDLVTGFEVIEHLSEWRSLLAEARRVLRPEGVFLVSTPNKLYYTESRGAEGPNPFHTHEFEFAEFQAALAEFFPCITVLMQNHVEAVAFYPEGLLPPIDARVDGVRGTAQEAHFFLAVCSTESVAPLRGLLYVHQGSNLLRERERHIQSLQRELDETRAQRDEMMRIHAELTRHLEEQNRWALQVREEVEEHRRWAAQLDQELNVARDRLNQLHKELEDRTTWAISLNERVQDFEARWNMLRASRWIKLGRKIGVGPQIDEDNTTPGGGSGGEP
jgi:ubiquinone/menaquinone biosynthesis C-methylase UbiE